MCIRDSHKNAMLKSVYENGGFYIGKYEVGTETLRTTKAVSYTHLKIIN